MSKAELSEGAKENPEAASDMYENIPKRLVVDSKEELYRKLQEAEADVREGRTSSAEEVFGRLEKKYRIKIR